MPRRQTRSAKQLARLRAIMIGYQRRGLVGPERNTFDRVQESRKRLAQETRGERNIDYRGSENALIKFKQRQQNRANNKARTKNFPVRGANSGIGGERAQWHGKQRLLFSPKVGESSKARHYSNIGRRALRYAAEVDIYSNAMLGRANQPALQALIRTHKRLQPPRLAHLENQPPKWQRNLFPHTKSNDPSALLKVLKNRNPHLYRRKAGAITLRNALANELRDMRRTMGSKTARETIRMGGAPRI